MHKGYHYLFTLIYYQSTKINVVYDNVFLRFIRILEFADESIINNRLIMSFQFKSLVWRWHLEFFNILHLSSLHQSIIQVELECLRTVYIFNKLCEARVDNLLSDRDSLTTHNIIKNIFNNINPSIMFHAIHLLKDIHCYRT